MNAKKESRPAATGTAIVREVFGTKPRKDYITKFSIMQVLVAIISAILLIWITVWGVIYFCETNNAEFVAVEHKVTYGDTLWSIAKEYKPDNMTMDRYMAWVYEHNDGGMIYPGDVVIMAEVR